MYKYLIILFLVGNVLYGQGINGLNAINKGRGTAKIKGAVLDGINNTPVEFANVALWDIAINKAVDGAVCNEKGEFVITKVGEGRYKLVISFIGYESIEVQNVNVNAKNDDVFVKLIKLNPNTEVLKEVSVEAKKDLIEEKIDRTVYNAESDLTTRGGDASDVLRRTPMLSVDNDGNVSMRGNQNVTILINGKPSSLLATNVGDALKQIPADLIKSVEVITSPSARYDAEGSAGVINIVLKKNTLEGLNLSVNSAAGYRGSHLGLNGSLKKGKFGMTLGGFGRYNYNITGSFINDQTIKNNPTSLFNTTQTANTYQSGIFGHYTLGMDYNFTEKSFLNGSIRYGNRSQYQEQNNFQTTIHNLINDSSQIGHRDVNSINNSQNVDINLTYTYQFSKPQQELSILGLYSRNDRTNNFENTNKNPMNTEEIISKVKNENPSINEEATGEINYQHPINKDHLLEGGGKNILRVARSNFNYYTATGNSDYVQTKSTQQNNSLSYYQNITAGYLSYTVSLPKSFGLKVGGRYEFTYIAANTADGGNIPIAAYPVFVPSVNISKKIGKSGGTLKLSYNRRIQRPSIQYLNPNIQAPNPLNISYGDPTLLPEYTNNYEIGYSNFIKGSSISASLFYRETMGSIQAVRKTSGDTIVTTYKNIGTEQALGTNISLNVNIGKFTLNAGGDVFYNTLSNNDINPLFTASNSGVVFSGRLFGGYNFANGISINAFSHFRSKSVELQGTRGGFGFYIVSIVKNFKNKKGGIGLSFENFLGNGLTIRNQTTSPVLDQNNTQYVNNIGIGINFNYRIGKVSTEAPKRIRTINNDDLKDGGGNQDGASGGGSPSPTTPQRTGENIRPSLPPNKDMKKDSIPNKAYPRAPFPELKSTPTDTLKRK